MADGSQDGLLMEVVYPDETEAMMVANAAAAIETVNTSTDASTALPQQQEYEQTVMDNSSEGEENAGNGSIENNNGNVWEHNAVCRLIDIYKDHMEEFKVTTGRKLDIWKKVSAILKKDGYNFSYLACDKKIRMLKYRFRRINEENDKAMYRKAISWEFYSKVAEFMAADPTLPTRPIKPVPETSPSTPKDDSGLTWTRAAVLLLIDLYKKYSCLLDHPGVTKASIHQKLSDEMKKHGHSYAPEVCDRKIRSLIYRYRIVAHGKSLEKRHRKWEYFDLMEDFVKFKEKEHTRRITKKITRRELCLAPSTTLPQVSKTWSHEAILSLIDTYSEFKPQFRQPGVKKMEVWKKVSAKLKSLGYNYSLEDCDKKVRGLRYRFKHIVDDTLDDPGKQPTKWYYYHHVEKLFRDEPYFVMRLKKTLNQEEETNREEATTHENHTETETEPTAESPIAPSTSEQPSTSDQQSAADQLSVNATMATQSSSSSQPQTSNTTVPSLSRTTHTATTQRLGKCHRSQFQSKKRKRKDNEEEEPPSWFIKFAEEQRTQMQELIALQETALEVAKERNSILKSFAEILANK